MWNTFQSAFGDLTLPPCEIVLQQHNVAIVSVIEIAFHKRQEDWCIFASSTFSACSALPVDAGRDSIVEHIAGRQLAFATHYQFSFRHTFRRSQQRRAAVEQRVSLYTR